MASSMTKLRQLERHQRLHILYETLRRKFSRKPLECQSEEHIVGETVTEKTVPVPSVRCICDNPKGGGDNPLSYILCER